MVVALQRAGIWWSGAFWVIPLSLGPVAAEAGEGRLVLPAASWSDVVDLALLEILEAGHGAPQVTRRLTALLADLVDDLPHERHDPLLHHRRRLADHVAHHAPARDHATWLVGDRLGLGGSRTVR